jgi:hypothetical protein
VRLGLPDAGQLEAAVAASAAGELGTLGIDLALDRNGEPIVSTLDDVTSRYATCTGDCTGTTGQWRVTPVVDVGGLNSTLPPVVPASCSGATWGMYVGPSLALDPLGRPVVSFTANVKAFGGQCGTGSSATTTDSFLYSFSP